MSIRKQFRLFLYKDYINPQMNLDAFFLSCLLEGLPIKIRNYFSNNEELMMTLKVSMPDLYNIIHSYISSSNMVGLYRSAASLSFSESAIPLFLKDSSVKKILNEMADRYEQINPVTFTYPSSMSFGAICDYLNPLVDRQTYVLKSRVHHWMYEEIIAKNALESILEIGVFYGGSTHAWRIRLPDLHMYSLDLNFPLQDSALLDRTRCQFIQGSAIDRSVLTNAAKHGPYSIIIDDASHIPAHQIATFLHLTSTCTYTSVYVVEDVDDTSSYDSGFTRFTSLLSQYQENYDLSIFLSAVSTLLNDETLWVVDSFRQSRDGQNVLKRINVQRYGNNFSFNR